MRSKWAMSEGLLFSLLFAIFVSPAIAADFRGSELGGPCTSISERELALGSNELGDPSRLEQHRFSGEAARRDAMITYLCKDGLLSLVDLRFNPGIYAVAVADLDAIYGELTGKYGMSYLEDSPRPQAGGNPSKYQAMWKAKGFHVSLALWTSGPDWFVFAVLTPNGE